MDKDKAKEQLNKGKEKVTTWINNLPFRAIADNKISSETRTKFPVMDKLIPLTNFIACGLAVILVIVVVASIGGSGGISRGFLPNTTWEGEYMSLFGPMYTIISFDRNNVRESYTDNDPRTRTDVLTSLIFSGVREGVYMVSGDTVTITWNDWTISEGTIIGNSLRIDGKVVNRRRR
jgi:hypothetical protein